MNTVTQLLVASGVGFPAGLAIHKWFTPWYLKHREHVKKVNAEIQRRIEEEEREAAELEDHPVD